MIDSTINANNLSTFITSVLGSQIINLELLPGTKISEMKLAKQYNCSRTPVRDAFYELRLKDYLDTRPQVGTFVSKINLTRVAEIHFIRESVEAAVLKLGIATGSFEHYLPMLQACVNEQELAYAQQNSQRFTDLDLIFHNTLYSAVDKEFVKHYCGEDDVHYSRLRFMLTRRNASVMVRTIHEHQQILDAIRAKDTSSVEPLVRSHLSNISNFLRSAEAQDEAMFHTN